MAGASTPSRWAVALRIGAATAAISVLLSGVAAQDVFAAPEANRVSGLDCKLDTTANTGTVDKLLADLAGAGIAGNSEASPEIAFVVVYSLNNDNDGQPLSPKGVTGPIICVNDNVAGIVTTKQTNDIPASGSGVTTLDAEDVFILRYQLGDGTIEKVLCHSTNDNTDCFRISPLVD